MTGSVGAAHDAWSAGDSYDLYMGRWSRQIANRFVRSLDAPENADWLDLGCGTGALTRAILEHGAPRSVTGVDPSEGFVAHARSETNDPRASFHVGTADDMAVAPGSIDLAVSGLALNFVPDPQGALEKLRAVMRPGGQIAVYVWDYPGGGMGFIDAFWRAAESLFPVAVELNESRRFPFCTRNELVALFRSSGLEPVSAEAIEVDTVFPDFAAFWRPFTLGAGPAPGFLSSLDDDAAVRLQDTLRAQVGDGPIRMPARAWSLRAFVTS
jgi:SAM-dependent methyltransferase